MDLQIYLKLMNLQVEKVEEFAHEIRKISQ